MRLTACWFAYTASHKAKRGQDAGTPPRVDELDGASENSPPRGQVEHRVHALCRTFLPEIKLSSLLDDALVILTSNAC